MTAPMIAPLSSALRFATSPAPHSIANSASRCAHVATSAMRALISLTSRAICISVKLCQLFMRHFCASQPSSMATLFDARTRAVGSLILSFFRLGRTRSNRLQTGEIVHCGGLVAAPLVEHAASRLVSNSALLLCNLRIDFPFCCFDASTFNDCTLGLPFHFLRLVDCRRCDQSSA
mgnify:CR=1 FL=1